MIAVSVNDNIRNIAEESTLLSLIQEMQTVSQGIAIAVNNKVVARNEWESFLLSADDQILIIQATQGG